VKIAVGQGGIGCPCHHYIAIYRVYNDCHTAIVAVARRRRAIVNGSPDFTIGGTVGTVIFYGDPLFIAGGICPVAGYINVTLAVNCQRKTFIVAVRPGIYM